MRYFVTLLWAAKIALAFPTLGPHGKDVSKPLYRNDTRFRPSSSTPPPIMVEVDVEVEVEVEVESPPTITLIPTVHWSVDTSSTDHLIPSQGNQVYYAENGINDPSQQHQMGAMDVNYAAPAVILDHSDSLSVSFDPTLGLVITFSSEESLNIATSSWSPETGLLMVTYLEGCGDYENKDYCYFKVSSINCTPGMICVASGASISHLEALASADITWGTYYPSTPQPPSYGSGTAASGNSTTDSGETTDSDESTAPLCGPADPKYGLPSAPLGANFDLALDDCFGYEAINSTDYASYLASMSDGDVLEDNPEDVVDTSSDLEGDDYLFNTTLFNVTRRSNSLEKRIKGFNEPISVDLFKKNINFKLPSKQKTVDTPFGQGVLLKAFGTKTTPKSKGSADLSIYCVECGASGGINLSGKASFAVTTGITSAELVAIADLQIVFQIGVVANAKYEQKFDFPIADIGIPGLSFGIVTIGPQISIGTDVSFNAVASGQLLAGAKFGFQNAKSVINFKDQSKSQSSGWTPQFEPILKASGNIELSAEVGFPLGLSCGLTVKGFSKISAGIVERPAIEAKAQFAATLEGTKGAITTTDGCQGIATQITFKNFLYVALDAFKTKKQYDLMAPFSKVLDKGCIKLSGTSSQPSRRQISNETIVDVTGDIDLSDANYTDIVFPDLATTDYNSTDGTDFISLMDSTSSFSLTACSDGNLYYQPKADNETLADYSCSTLFQSIQTNVIADGLGRILHYYNNTMSKLGVSRLRVSDEETIPIGSSYLSLNPSDEDADVESPDTFTAFDSNGNQFFPVVCAYTNATMPPKVFVVNNVTTGLDILQSPDLEFIVTGGLIDECYYLPIIADLDDGSDFDDDWNVNETDEGDDSEYDSVE